jgi:hypothetical protein
MLNVDSPTTAIATRMAMQFDGVTECPSGYTHGDDYVHKHRDAEHEHEEPPKPMGVYEAAQQTFLLIVRVRNCSITT